MDGGMVCFRCFGRSERGVEARRVGTSPTPTMDGEVVCFRWFVRSDRGGEDALLFLSIPGGTNAGWHLAGVRCSFKNQLPHASPQPGAKHNTHHATGDDGKQEQG